MFSSPAAGTAGGAHRRHAIMTTRLVVLVPGFFGFTSVGAVSYFEDVEQALGRDLRRRGVEARVVRCATQPTASITRRADALRRELLGMGGLRAREIHFVGHSTGGLDVRMLLTPGVRIARGNTEARIAKRTRTAISVTTPHHGTPLANHFTTFQGETLLLVLTALATSGPGRGTILAAAKAIALVAQLDDWLGRKGTTLDRIAGSLLSKMRLDRRNPVWKYLGEIQRDQGAILQLTPEGIDMFDAAAAIIQGSTTAVSSQACRSRARSSGSSPSWIRNTSLYARCSGSCTRSRRSRTRAIPIRNRTKRYSKYSITASASGDPGYQRRHRANFGRHTAGCCVSREPII